MGITEIWPGCKCLIALATAFMTWFIIADVASVKRDISEIEYTGLILSCWQIVNGVKLLLIFQKFNHCVQQSSFILSDAAIRVDSVFTFPSTVGAKKSATGVTSEYSAGSIGMFFPRIVYIDNCVILVCFWIFFCWKLDDGFGCSMEGVNSIPSWWVVINVIHSPNSKDTGFQSWRANTSIFLELRTYTICKARRNFLYYFLWTTEAMTGQCLSGFSIHH